MLSASGWYCGSGMAIGGFYCEGCLCWANGWMKGLGGICCVGDIGDWARIGWMSWFSHEKCVLYVSWLSMGFSLLVLYLYGMDC